MSPALPSKSYPLIVIVDDDPSVREALQFALELEGFTVQACGSGEALLEMNLPLDNVCLVVDERLPGISGLEAISRLRMRAVTLPAILITSHPQPHLRAAAAAAATPIVEKPLIGDSFVKAIRRALAA